MSRRVLNAPPSESVIISILLPVSIDGLCAAARGLQNMECYQPDATFMRQVEHIAGCAHLEIYEMDPPPSSYTMRGDGAGI